MKVVALVGHIMEFLKDIFMNKFRFHLLGLVHLPANKTYMSCAFTQKNIKMATMLKALGHEVIYYGAEGSDVPCDKFVQTHSLADIRRDYGEGDNRFEIGYDWTNKDFKHDFNGERKPATLKFYAKAIEEINKNKRPDDFLLCTQGYYHKPIADAVKLHLTCETGIGYRGSVKDWWRAFESSYIQNYTYGYEGQLECINGSYYDRVIPNYFDENDIQFSNAKKDYYLFIGRMIARKGIETAAMTCNAIGKKLIIAGQGAHVDSRGYLVPNEDPDFELPPGTWEYVGYANVEKRKELMAHAIATFVPTIYLEIFGGVHIESMLSGTPAITTNFGVFPGTVRNGINGFTCNTLQDFVDAAKLIKFMNPQKVRKSAEFYLMDNVKLQYQKWFEDLYKVWESSVDPKVKGWSRVSN
jgi:glycosyltransferase involved in cell wall biosynthesis